MFWAGVLAVSKDFMKEKTWAISTSKFKFTHSQDALIPGTPLEVQGFLGVSNLTHSQDTRLLMPTGGNGLDGKFLHFL